MNVQPIPGTCVLPQATVNKEWLEQNNNSVRQVSHTRLLCRESFLLCQKHNVILRLMSV